MTPEQTEQLKKTYAWEEAENYLPKGKILRYRVACDSCGKYLNFHSAKECRDFIYNHENHETRVML